VHFHGEKRKKMHFFHASVNLRDTRAGSPNEYLFHSFRCANMNENAAEEDAVFRAGKKL
jgi:hypothetical protein